MKPQHIFIAVIAGLAAVYFMRKDQKVSHDKYTAKGLREQYKGTEFV